jgi:hypothetical protein
MSRNLYRGCVTALSATLLQLAGHAAVLHVPGDYFHIQTAINAATNGDVVLVSSGLYVENINFKGKAITLTSTNPADPAVVRSTIIRASGQSSVVSFGTGETTNSVIAGFTIASGSGTVNPAFGTSIVWGGGIYCSGSSPTIVGNVIMGNSVPNGSSGVAGYGAAIACIDSDAVITRNVLIANTGYAGGGILVYLGKPHIASNLICSNSVVAGGGVVLLSGGQLLNNNIFANTGQLAGSVYAVSDASGQAVVSGNTIFAARGEVGVYLASEDTITRFAFNDVWNNTNGDYPAGTSRTGVDGNISQDPLFVNFTNKDYHLQETSPCINAGDNEFQPLAGELDFYGNPRVWSGRVDIGAAEYFDNFRPDVDAGPNQLAVVTVLPASFVLDGSASSDPNGAPLSFLWTQLTGPAVTLAGPGTAQPSFTASQLGTYVFQLVVNNGSYNSFPDIVQVTVTNAPPIANAGEGKLYDLSTTSITLDGSGSFDPENMPLTYHWTQLSGWIVQLSDPGSVKPTFTPWPGTYVFQLVVNDGLQDSKPSQVTIVVGADHAPVANAGPSLYVSTNAVALDGTGSYDPDGVGILTYQWKQVSGPAITMTGTNTSAPLLSGFKQNGAIQKCVFQLVVSDGTLTSQPTNVTVTIVPNFGTNAIYDDNPPFDPTLPTILAFGGGNCVTGQSMSFGPPWDTEANWLTVPSYGSAYNSYGDMLMVYLSSVAPDYRKPIQTIGFSTGNKPAMQVASYVNTTYRDARYAVNRVSLCDAVCNNLSSLVSTYQANPVAGEQAWVDNYISNDPAHALAPLLPGAFNITCSPARAHAYPVTRYAGSSLSYSNSGFVAFGYLSVIGDGKNYQLNTVTNKYYFQINSAEALVYLNATLYPGKILAPVQLTGPTNGSTIDTNGTVFGCQTVENAVRYQLLFGSNPDRVMDFNVVSDTTNPPSQFLSTLPLDNTWWTVKAYDQFGSSIFADPRLIQRPANQPPVADAGANLVFYAGVDGIATVTLSGANSSDPDGDPLSYAWAWAINGVAYVTNGANLGLELPVGVYTFQLMVNDGHFNSQPAQVSVTVVAPLQCSLRISPSALNPRSNGAHILASIQFPDAATLAQVDNDTPLTLFPSGSPARRTWTAADDSNTVKLFAFFDRDGLSGLSSNGPLELTVAGKLHSGQWFYGTDTIQVDGNNGDKVR